MLIWLQSARTNARILSLTSDPSAYYKAQQRLSISLLPKFALYAALRPTPGFVR